MKISRRLFVSAGLLCFVGALYVKEGSTAKDFRIISNNIETFVRSYNVAIPVEESADIFGDTTILEKNLASLLSSKGIEETANIVNKLIRNDYQISKIRSMNGWIVSEVEFGLLIIRNRYV